MGNEQIRISLVFQIKRLECDVRIETEACEHGIYIYWNSFLPSLECASVVSSSCNNTQFNSLNMVIYVHVTVIDYTGEVWFNALYTHWQRTCETLIQDVWFEISLQNIWSGFLLVRVIACCYEVCQGRVVLWWMSSQRGWRKVYCRERWKEEYGGD